MRKLTSFCLCTILIASSIFCQDLSWESSVNTYAVIIGISDYQEEQRTDLQFAHRDAEVFADYLKSEAGGNTPDQNIKLLLNNQATLAAIDNALNWLLISAKKGERVIIYFSGHGDVEKQTLWQLGYLLAYDTPFNNYRNNAVRLEDLNDLVTTLSVQKEVEVVLITDACRSGKLSGSDNRGPSLTAEQLSKQAANEVRIMSCKPDQKSYEGKIWGGGRGVFSYHFINGLKGIADEDEDKKVTHEEVEFYLRDKFREDLKSQRLKTRQNPQFTGNETFRLSNVNQDELAALEVELNAASAVGLDPEFTNLEAGAVASRGNDDTPESAAPIAFKSNAFDDLINFVAGEYVELEGLSNRLFIDAGIPLDTNLQNAIELAFSQIQMVSLKDKPVLLQQLMLNNNFRENLPESFKIPFAIALHDRAQRAINEYLRGDPNELRKRYEISWGDEYSPIPHLLKLAGELIDPESPLYHKIQVKYHYFAGVMTRLKAVTAIDYVGALQEAMDIQNKALQLDDKAAYIHNELGVLNKRLWTFEGAKNDSKFKKAKSHFEQAIELSPGWVIPYSNLGGLYALDGKNEEAKNMTQKAMELKDDYHGSYINYGIALENEKDYLSAESLYRTSRKLAPTHYLPYRKLGLLSLIIGEYKSANSFFQKADSLANGLQQNDSDSDGVIDYVESSVNNPPDYSTDIDIVGLLKKLETAPNNPDLHYQLGIGYKNLGQFQNAEKHLRKVIELQAEHPEVYNDLGMMFYENKQYHKAEIFLQKYVSQYPDSVSILIKLGNLYQSWERHGSEEEVYRKIIEKEKRTPTFFMAYERLCILLEDLSRFIETEQLLLNYQKTNPDSFDRRRLVDQFYDRMLERFPKQGEWFYKKAVFYQEEYGTFNSEYVIELYNKALELEADFSKRAEVYYKLGVLYALHNLLSKAAAAFERSLDIHPNQIDAVFRLIRVYNRSFRYNEAKVMLDNLHEMEVFDLDNLLLLANYNIRLGHYAMADSLLHQAEAIPYEEMPEINKQFATFYMIKGEMEKSIARLKKILTQNPHDSWSMYSIASQYALEGKEAEAITWLEKALEKGFWYQKVLKYDPDWNELRGKQKFNGLLNTYFGN